MMTELQLSEIRNYLLSKKLPIDILLEMQDHFMSQIGDLMKEENIDFETAFQETKQSWSKDLKLYWDGSLDLEDNTPFLRKVRRQIFLDTTKTALKYSFILIGLILLSAYIFNPFVFEWAVCLAIGSPFIYALYRYIRKYKTMVLWRKYPKYILTLHQTSMFLFFSFFAILLNFFRMFFETPEKFQIIIQLRNSQYTTTEFLLLVSSLLLLTAGTWFSIISQKKYLQQIEKIKPFLKYLNESSQSGH